MKWNSFHTRFYAEYFCKKTIASPCRCMVKQWNYVCDNFFRSTTHCKGDFMAFADCEKNLLYVQRERGKKVENGVGRFHYMLHSTTSLLFFLRCIPWKLLILICTSLSRSSVVVYWSVCGIAVEMDRILLIISYVLHILWKN